jgi:hypothetical protein
MGPVGWLALGTKDENQQHQSETPFCSFDCWKDVLHDVSTEPSRGMLLKDVCERPEIVKIEVTENHNISNGFPKISLLNACGEQFDIEYVRLPDGLLHIQFVFSPIIIDRIVFMNKY